LAKYEEWILKDGRNIWQSMRDEFQRMEGTFGKVWGMNFKGWNACGWHMTSPHHCCFELYHSPCHSLSSLPSCTPLVTAFLNSQLCHSRSQDRVHCLQHHDQVLASPPRSTTSKHHRLLVKHVASLYLRFATIISQALTLPFAMFYPNQWSIALFLIA